MSPITTIIGLMVPLSEYASVSEDDSLEQALRALNEAQQKLSPGKQPHRAILVRDAGGNFVGKIDHFVILDALLPWHEKEFRIPMMQRAWVSQELARQTMENLALLQEHLSDIRERASSIRVRDLRAQEAISVEHKIPLVGAIRLLVQHQTLSLLVRYEDAVVGVLRLSDVFDHLSDYILERHDDGA